MEKVAGIAEIETDTTERTCSFKVTNPELDYAAVLNQLAETNDHIAGFEIL